LEDRGCQLMDNPPDPSGAWNRLEYDFERIDARGWSEEDRDDRPNLNNCLAYCEAMMMDMGN
jgi:hypothetical protein